MEEKDIYLITPEVEAQLTHVIALLEDFLEDESLEGTPCDPYIKEAWETLLKLPFFAKHR